MKSALFEFFRAHHEELYAALVIAVLLGVIALIRRGFAAKVATWPAVKARVENFFLDVTNRGINRIPHTHAVLAYGYSVADVYYSGEIRLWSGESSIEALEKEIIGKEISMQYNPRRPEVSIFTKHKVRGWDVVKDRRLSLYAWLDWYMGA